jgi:hypothetical protein
MNDTPKPEPFEIHDHGDTLTIVIRAPRDYIYLVLYALGFAFWLFVILSPLATLNRNVLHPVGPLNTALAVIFLIGFPIYLVLSTLWATTGREIVTIAGGDITVRRELAGIGRTRRLPLVRLDKVSLARDRPAAVVRFSASPRVRGGPIRLQEKATEPSDADRALPEPPAIIHFGAGLNLAHARQLAALIRERSGLGLSAPGK